MKSLVASCVFVLLGLIALSDCGAIPKESESVSSSVSTSVSSSSIPIKEDKKGKKEKIGKVLYTAPYSSVRVSKKLEGKVPSPVYTGPQKTGKGLIDGPVLIRDKSSTAATSTTTTSSTTTEAPALSELVTEKDSESAEASGSSEELATSTTADLITQ